MQKGPCYVFVSLPDHKTPLAAGIYTRELADDGLPIGIFEYHSGYLEAEGAFALDPFDLPLRPGRHQTQRLDGVFGAFRDALPDYWGRYVFSLTTGQPVDEVSLMLDGQEDRAGALVFTALQEPAFPASTALTASDLKVAQEAIDDAVVRSREDQDPTRYSEAGRSLPPATALGGARPKATVRHDDALWVAKFGAPGDRWSQPRVEYGVMTLARKCGLDVADCQLVETGVSDVLLVRRFDRVVGARGLERRHMISALSVMQVDDSPLSRHDWSYLSFARGMKEVCEEPTANLRELFRRICFNAAVSNADDHPLNHALLRQAGGWALSPAYDLTPFPSISVEHRDLAMACGPEGRRAARSNIVAAAEEFMLSESEAAVAFDEIAGAVAQSWERVLMDCGASGTDVATVRRAFEYDGLQY